MRQNLIRDALVRYRMASTPTVRNVGFIASIVLIIGVLNALAAKELGVVIRRAQFAETMAFASTLRTHMTVHYAMHGEWPSAEDMSATGSLLPDPTSFGIVDMQLNRGSFNLVVNRKPSGDRAGTAQEQWNVSFLRQSPGGSLGAVAVWVCGRASPVTAEGYAELPNLTDVERKYLPTVCR